MRLLLVIRLGLSALLLGAGVPTAAQFQIDQTKIPSGSNNNSSTENVDFGDVDLDGDWDVVMADGGDDGNDQNRIWINLGGLQAMTEGTFGDETATRFPAVSDDSRDIEFVDFDDDSDLDIYVSNTAQLALQGNRWWTNLGGLQAGSLGFYADETSTRWIGLAGDGSSIPASQLVNGSFVDWSCDCDFGDLDNDGDMDLVHSTYGVSFGGLTPTRIFLNDGTGHFTEFNPSNFTLPASTISDGDPGLWCEGEQQANTTNTDGTYCDIATTALDIDVGDIDGDFDLDILHGARNEAPRMFANRLDGSTLAPAAGNGDLLFRDVTGLVFPSGYYTGTTGHYEQEMGDFDGDGDLDIYGLNWQTAGFRFDDIVMSNQGDGTFGTPTTLSNSLSDDNEADFFDMDNDGDLDVWVANFSGQDRLYENVGESFQEASVPSFSAVSLDADVCDTDGDGDYDVLVAEDNFRANTFLENVSGTPDTHAPYLPNIEDVGDQTVQPEGIPVRVHVYDNAPYYITWFNDTVLRVRSRGTLLPDIPAKSSGGQIFRAELPGNLFGRVKYWFVSADEYGNSAASAQVTYQARSDSRAAPAPTGGPILPGTTYGSGTPGARGVPEIEPLTVVLPGAPLFLHGKGLEPGAPFVFLVTARRVEPPLDLGKGLRLNVGGRVLARVQGRVDDEGRALFDGGTVPADLPAGTRAYAQIAVRDEAGWAVSPGLELVSR